MKNRFLISTVIFALILTAVIVLVVWPALSEIRLINRQVYEERVRLEKLYVRGQLQKRVRENFNRIKPDLNFLDEIWLKEGEELRYITALEQAATVAGVELKTDIGELKRAPQQPFSTLNFNFEVKGEWEAIMHWLQGVEQIPYYTNIKEINVAVREDGQPGESKARMATVNIAADTYWLISQ